MSSVEVECPGCGDVFKYIVETDTKGDVIDAYLSPEEMHDD